jgi:hypothetical protein
MNDEHLDHLINSHLHGTLTPEQSRDLEQRLLHSAADRERFWQEAETHAMLHDSLQKVLGVPLPTLPAKVDASRRWLSWRPLTAAAAGLVFGMFCTSLVFGYVKPRAMAGASRLIGLVDGSFEEPSGGLASGFPSEFGKWSGDKAEFVSLNAQDGKQALRFVQAEREPQLTNSGAGACDVFQLVDLRSLKSETELGDTMLELSAQFLDARDAPGETVRFVARLHVFAGSPEGLREDWPMPKKEALATGSGIVFSKGGSTQTWRSVTSKVFLPQEADFAVVHLLVNIPEGRSNRTTPATFGVQYADDVLLRLKTQPTLPVQMTQR